MYRYSVCTIFVSKNVQLKKTHLNRLAFMHLKQLLAKKNEKFHKKFKNTAQMCFQLMIGNNCLRGLSKQMVSR